MERLSRCWVIDHEVHESTGLITKDFCSWSLIGYIYNGIYNSYSS